MLKEHLYHISAYSQLGAGYTWETDVRVVKRDVLVMRKARVAWRHISGMCTETMDQSTASVTVAGPL